MSTTTIAVDVVNDVAGDIAGEREKPSRKFPLPCWTQGETLALIDAYRKRWYALRRGYLRTADWDAVAETVVSGFPGVLPSKTSAQCRHKMEKLRQRYRAEKQRSLSFPAGKFFSSWFFFENMDAMETGSEVGSGQNPGNPGFGIKPEAFFDQNTMKLKLNNGVILKNSSNTIIGRKIPNFEPEVPYMEADSDKEVDEPGFETGHNPVIGLFAPRGSEGKKYVRTLGDFKTNVVFNSVSGNEFHIKSSENENSLPPRLRVKRIERDAKDDDEIDDRFSIPSGIRGKYGRYIEPEMGHYRETNGFSKKGSNGNTKRERNNPIEEMVSAIKMLGEGFIKMEKMKMEMAMEMEKNRMDMELKRNELMLQSHAQIVDAFMRGFVEMNKKMKMAGVLPETS